MNSKNAYSPERFFAIEFRGRGSIVDGVSAIGLEVWGLYVE